MIFGSATVVLLWSCYFVVRDRAVILKQLWAGAVAEALLLTQLGICAINLVTRGRADMEIWEFWGYLLTSLVILPAAAAWAFAERTKWSSVVLAVAAMTVMFLQFRLIQLWG